MLDNLISQIKKQWPTILRYICLALVMGCLSLAMPILSGKFIDHIVKNYDVSIFIWFVIAIAITNFSQMILRYLRALVSTRTESILTYTVSNSLFQKFFSADCRELRDSDNAFTIDQISKDSHAVIRFFLTNIVEFFLKTFTILISAVYILRVDLFLSLIVFLLIPLYVLTFYKCRKKMHAARIEHKLAINRYFSSYSEQINKLYFVKKNSLAVEMGTRLRVSFKTMLETSLKAVRTDYVFANINQLFIVVAYICITAIGGYRVGTQTLSIGVFTVINSYFNMIIHSISYFLNLASQYQEARISVDRIKKTFSMADEVTGSNQLAVITSIKCKNLCVQHANKHIFSVSYCDFRLGHIYGIIGRNGSGKTTFINTLIGLCAGECSGEILYSGMNIATLNMNELRRSKISYLEQEPTMMNMDVNEYLAFGLEMNISTQEEQRELLSLWNVDYLVNRTINENGANMSGGEKKKLALVRSLSKSADVYLLDEPTAALDSKATEVLINKLRRKKQEAIILVISHDPLILKECDSIYEIIDGEMKQRASKVAN